MRSGAFWWWLGAFALTTTVIAAIYFDAMEGKRNDLRLQRACIDRHGDWRQISSKWEAPEYGCVFDVGKGD